MIRLAVRGLADEVLAGAAARLRNVLLQPIASETDAPDASANADALVLAEDGSRHRTTVELAERCVQAGQTVVWVTAEGIEADSWERLLAAAQTGQGTCLVVNPQRFQASRQLVRQQLDDGRLGEVGLIRMHRWDSAAKNGGANKAGSLRPLLWQDVDIALWLAGVPPHVVYATQSRLAAAPMPHCLQLHLGFPSGAMALIGYAPALPEGDGYASLSVIGSSGAAYADDHQNMQLWYRGGHPAAVRADDRALLWVALFRQLALSLRSPDAARQATEHGKQVQALLRAVDESLQSRQAIPLEIG
ncbi:MAG: hypothetical protein AB7F89_12290 [Pirellulaceae bacterium]